MNNQLFERGEPHNSASSFNTRIAPPQVNTSGPHHVKRERMSACRRSDSMATASSLASSSGGSSGVVLCDSWTEDSASSSLGGSSLTSTASLFRASETSSTASSSAAAFEAKCRLGLPVHVDRPQRLGRGNFGRDTHQPPQPPSHGKGGFFPDFVRLAGRSNHLLVPPNCNPFLDKPQRSP